MSSYIYLLVAAIVTYGVRTLPMLLMNKPIKNNFLKSFLYYCPYITLAAMTFPAILTVTDNPINALITFCVGFVVASTGAKMYIVVICCVVTCLGLGFLL